MATSVVMAAIDGQTTKKNPSLALPQDEDHQHHEIRRSSGRRKSKGCELSSCGQKKKQPQRGMGVEKLELLRLQERRKKMMTEINTTTTNHQAFSSNIIAAADPSLMISADSSAPLQQSYLSFHGQMAAAAPSHPLQTRPFGIGCSNRSDILGNGVMTGFSRELSSTPNVVSCYSQHCTACHKKKKVNGRENLGSDRHKQMCNVGDCGLLGLNMRDNQNVMNQENQRLGTKIPMVGYAAGNGKQGVEVVAVHRKGSSDGGSVLMEYEFFPSSGKAGDTQNDELVMMNLQVGPSQTTSPAVAGFDASTCIDLSLKLSY